MSTTETKSAITPEFKASVEKTLGNEQWLKTNTAAIKKLLPSTWTHISNLNGLQIGFQLKVLGVDWRNQDEFGRVMVFFEKIGIMQRQNIFQVRADPHWELDTQVELEN